MRAGGQFDGEGASEAVARAQEAFVRGGHTLDAQGYVRWGSGHSSENALALGEEGPTGRPEEVEISRFVEVRVSDGPLLIDSLRRLALAVRPLIDRRRGRAGIEVRDEYDVQDFVEVLLRSLHSDVRAEERTPSYAGSSSVMDFLLKDKAIALEIKVTAPRRTEREIKPELLVDIDDYRRHPNVQTLIAIVYDLASTIRNPAGFENDLSGSREGLDVRVVVVGWPRSA